MTNHPVVIVDAHNLFIRGYLVSPRMSNVGYTVGGITIFLQTLGSIVDKFSPSHVHLVWEGGNGSPWRRSLYRGYKNGRRPRRFNRPDGVEDDVSDEVRQMRRLVTAYLGNMPVKQFAVGGVEADDIIYEIIRRLPEEKRVIIVSTDRDFYQLVTDKITIYNPVKKTMIGVNEVVKEFGAMPHNVVISRCMMGDDSDNIPGIKGVGEKWLEKNLPLLLDKEDRSLIDVREAVEAVEKKGVVHKRILEEFNTLKLNWQLMHLGSAPMTFEQKSKIESMLHKEDEEAYTFNRLFIMKELIVDQLTSEFLAPYWHEAMNGLMIRSRREKLFE